MKIPEVCCIHVSKEGIPCINKTICQVQEEVYQLGIYSYSCSIFGTSVSFLELNELQLGFLLKGMYAQWYHSFRNKIDICFDNPLSSNLGMIQFTVQHLYVWSSRFKIVPASGGQKLIWCTVLDNVLQSNKATNRERPQRESGGIS